MHAIEPTALQLTPPAAPDGYHWELVKDPNKMQVSSPMQASSPRAVMPPASPMQVSSPRRVVPSASPLPLAYGTPTHSPRSFVVHHSVAPCFAFSPTPRSLFVPAVVPQQPAMKPAGAQTKAVIKPFMKSAEASYEAKSISIAKVQTKAGSGGAVDQLRRDVEDLKRQLAELTQTRGRAIQAKAKDVTIEKKKIYRGDMILMEKVHNIERRGNLQIDGSTGHVNLLNPIMFVKRTTNDEPTAEFEDGTLATVTVRDLAELSSHFPDPIYIEGHTRGGTTKFWQTLANDRARIVAEMMVEFGADPKKISTVGRPGETGLNETRTVVYFDIPEVTNPKELAKLEALEKHQRPMRAHSPGSNPYHRREWQSPPKGFRRREASVEKIIAPGANRPRDISPLKGWK